MDVCVDSIDMRGFGQSSAPKNLEAYGGKNVTGDFAALLGTFSIRGLHRNDALAVD